jgi:hypothetical protein
VARHFPQCPAQLGSAAATTVTAAATGHQPQSPVISRSHRSSASVTSHQPQSPVLSLSHWSSATVTAPQPQTPVISHSHQSSASVTGHQPQSPVVTEQLRHHIVAFVSPYTQLLTDFHRGSTSGRPCLLLLQRWNIISPLLGRQLLQNFCGWTASS